MVLLERVTNTNGAVVLVWNEMFYRHGLRRYLSINIHRSSIILGCVYVSGEVDDVKILISHPFNTVK